MSWLLRLLRGNAASVGNQRRRRSSSHHIQPQTPPGFIRRTDPNFYFLARKF